MQDSRKHEKKNFQMKIMIIDDDPTVCSSLKLLLSRKGYEVDFINHPNIAIEKIEAEKPELILLDMNFTIDTSGRQGMKLLKLIRAAHPQISVILMTGWATVQIAVEGMKLGAKDFIAKPWENKDLIASIQNIEKLHHEHFHTVNSDQEQSNQTIIGESDQMKEIMSMVDKVAATSASVLITGASGTGKELIAEAIHQGSPRKDAPFVKVNLGGIPTELFESEMFGHKKGAFTGAEHEREGRFAKANTGTIFLDEVGELELACQVKLLRVLQEKTFEMLGSSDPMKTDVRVISATNKDLYRLAIDGAFREDLFYRINLLHIHLPTLAQRSSDIPLLIKFFFENIATLYQADKPYVDDETMHWLSNQEYKGNIRQLKNIIERTFLLNLDHKTLTKKDFLPAFETTQVGVNKNSSLNLEAMEIETINKALAKHGHSISASSKALGITRSSLYRRIEKYGIKHEPKI